MNSPNERHDAEQHDVDPHEAEYDLAPVNMPPVQKQARPTPATAPASRPASRPAAGRPGTSAARTTPPKHAGGNTAGKAAGYVLMVLIMLGGAAAAFYGWQAYQATPDGGTAYGIKLTTRPGISGAAANFKFWGDVDNPYLRVNPRDEGGADIRTDVKKDTTLGSGLYWAIEPREVRDVRLIEVWDSRTFGDDLVDRIELPGNAWQAEGQQFVVELVGVKEQPEPWALPMLAAGVTAVLLMVGVFLWTAAV
ncbi:MAG: hypothetical protein ACFCVE_04435 [Phycisphaerae bacterium]